MLSRKNKKIIIMIREYLAATLRKVKLGIVITLSSCLLISCQSEDSKLEEKSRQQCDIGERAKTSLSDVIDSNAIYFVRYDSGQLEVDKGLITEWPYMNDPLNQSITAGVYKKPQKAIELLQKLHSNWIWVTWSNGFSIQKEEKQWDELGCFINDMHKSDINVTAYLSLANIFKDEVFENQANSKSWIRYDDTGMPVLYGNKEGRYIADLSNQEYQEYLIYKVKRALERKVDAIYLDNIIFSDYKDVIDILIKIREIASNESRYIPVYVNTRHPEIIKYSDLLLAEGSIEPGYYEDEGVYKNNIKELLGLRSRVSELQIPIKFEHNSHRGGHRRESVMKPSGYKKIISEAWAYNTSFYFAPEGVTLTEILQETTLGSSVVESIGEYFSFRKQNELFWKKSKLTLDSFTNDEIVIPSEFDDKVLVSVSENERYYYIQAVNYADEAIGCINIRFNFVFGSVDGKSLEFSSLDGIIGSCIDSYQDIDEGITEIMFGGIKHYKSVAIPKNI